MKRHESVTDSPVEDAIVQIESLCKSFDGTEILRGVSLQIEQGDLVSIIGPSGCGKSTFLRCINFLEIPDSGRISVDGIALERSGANERWTTAMEERAHALREQVGMVFQGFHLFAHRTVAENVMMAPMIVKGLKKAAARDLAMHQLSRVGLAKFANRYPGTLSGGQQQRAAIARALAMSPKVMLYDEPTSALDPELVDEVLQVMRDLDADGMTQLIVTHEMRFARDASDYIVFMEGGEIVEVSDEDEIFENPRDPRTRRFLKRFS
ncbi:Gln/Arg/Lys/His transport ATP-binding protein [Granulibacter bethesdensis]|uniref:Gln/Arg/Lys/His transport ATP-binding protein n=1 Tax=Granulibacter bethesdensis TaxID=364410 RepID=A0AAC9K900_9PROT|nr:Gln/Arg/Lys/His transport ATP-binding protein [Granulibacter bethesdensis]APH61713.1 Gln/Arg/Lys/His transport ATP-binding protein [Granulibacter bethesdensis]